MKAFRLFPGSLATRTVLLVVAVVAVAELATFAVVFHNGRAVHFRQTNQYVAGQIRLLQTILPGLDAQARQRIELADAGEQWLQLRRDGDAVPERIPEFGFASRLAVHLGRTLGEPVSLRHAGQGPRSGLWIGFMAGGERWWLILPPPRFEPPGLSRDLWGWLASALVVLVLIAGLFVRGIVGPLKRLGDAVASTGDGSSRTVNPEGPSEVCHLAKQHNRMVAQLAHAELERREMLAGLTHDLRTPLARLRVRLALLASDGEREGLARDVDDMERIVSQFLAFVRSDEKSAEPEPPLPIADAVSDVVAGQRELGRPVEMTVEETAMACQVAISHGNLQRILGNLIDNALQYGAPPIEVRLTAGRPGYVTLQVRDHGIGILEAQRERALEPFVQIDPARATGGSCGLGLAIVRRLVQACHGEIVLGEAPGGGLDVLVDFPIGHG